MMVMHKVLALLLLGVIFSSVRSGSSRDNFLRVLTVAAEHRARVNPWVLFCIL